ncbi:DUF4032 domain-containing protein [Haliangium ochraceum]|uniref:DUF4032 domain-containing protein n=1 Tax=Haliangium ochraceum TaxID=80816 RepID=UPI00019B9EBB|nr:DUF4032 domain-containing protein [Haliangium ochraceum]
MTVRPGHPDFSELPWQHALATWDVAALVPRPAGRSEHAVRYLCFGDAVYVIKELPTRTAHREYELLRALEDEGLLVAPPVGLVEGRCGDPEAEHSAALITRYLPFTYSYRELIAQAGLATVRAGLPDAFAGLLVELHSAGCFWGDCSLSNVLLRRDADGIDTVMVDAETAFLCERLSDRQRAADLVILVENVNAAMIELAAARGDAALDATLDTALGLGGEIVARYGQLWSELFGAEIIAPGEEHKIAARIERVHALGFDVRELDIETADDGVTRTLRLRPGRRHFHAQRLEQLTGVEVAERQARQLLSDLAYYRSLRHSSASANEALAALEWRAFAFEPMLERIRAIPGVVDPVQGYCELLVHRYLCSEARGDDVGTDAAFEDWQRCLVPRAA